MLTFKQAADKLGSYGLCHLCHMTWLVRLDSDKIAIRYHKTDVVTICSDGSYILNNGGFKTVTTKKRINQYSPANLFQSKFNWYVGNIPFTNGMVVR